MGAAASDWVGTDRRDVERFLHDELLEALPVHYDRDALLDARRAVYVIHQDVTYDYTKPVRDLQQRLVILPRSVHGDQRRVAHRLEVRTEGAACVRTRIDRFGNTVILATAPRVEERIEFRTRVVLVRRPTHDRSSSWTTSESTCTPLTTPDGAIGRAASSLGPVRDVLATADAMAVMVREALEYRHDVTGVRTTAADAWRLRAGVCQDMAHVMIAMCTTLGIRARYVSGHLIGDGASHAWVEVHDPASRKVVAIDPTHVRRTDLRYVTTATGRDYHDVAPTSGTYVGHGGRSTLAVRKSIRLAEID